MRTLFRRATLLTATLAGVAALAPAAAQAPAKRAAVAVATATAPAPDPGPTLDAARIAARPAAPEGAAPASMAAQLSRPAKFLVFGGAILLTGAIIGDDAGTVLMIGGGAIALYGLYQMLFDEGPSAGATSVTFAPPPSYQEKGDARR